MNGQPNHQLINNGQQMYTVSNTFSRVVKSQVLSTMSVIKDGTTKSHVVTDHFIVTELITAHKIMPDFLQTPLIERIEPTSSTKRPRMIEPTSVLSINKIRPIDRDPMFNPVEYLVGLEMEPTSSSLSSSGSDVDPSQKNSLSTPPLPLPPPNQKCCFD